MRGRKNSGECSQAVADANVSCQSEHSESDHRRVSFSLADFVRFLRKMSAEATAAPPSGSAPWPPRSPLVELAGEEDNLAVKCMEMSRAVWRRSTMPGTSDRTSSGTGSGGLGNLPGQNSSGVGSAFSTAQPPPGAPPGVASPRHALASRRNSSTSLGSGGQDAFVRPARVSMVEGGHGGDTSPSAAVGASKQIGRSPSSLPPSIIAARQGSSNKLSQRTWASKLLNAIGLGGKKDEQPSSARARMSSSSSVASPPPSSQTMGKSRRASVPAKAKTDESHDRPGARFQRVTSFGMFSGDCDPDFGARVAAAVEVGEPGGGMPAGAIAAAGRTASGVVVGGGESSAVEHRVRPPPAELAGETQSANGRLSGQTSSWGPFRNAGRGTDAETTAGGDGDSPGGPRSSETLAGPPGHKSRSPLAPEGSAGLRARANSVPTGSGGPFPPPGRADDPDGGDAGAPPGGMPPPPRKRATFANRQAPMRRASFIAPLGPSLDEEEA